MGIPVTTPRTKLIPKMRPESRGLVVVTVASTQELGLENHYERSQAHGEWGEQVMKCDGEGKMQTMNDEER